MCEVQSCIALTAHARGEAHERCLSAGMDGCLTKQIRASELLAAIADRFPAEPALIAPLTAPLTVR